MHTCNVWLWFWFGLQLDSCISVGKDLTLFVWCGSQPETSDTSKTMTLWFRGHCSEEVMPLRRMQMSEPIHSIHSKLVGVPKLKKKNYT